jgi:hypothetical protein
MLPPHVKVRPKELTSPLLNPHKGCATFQRFNGDPAKPPHQWSADGPTAFPPRQYDVAPGYLPTTVSYCRWFWSVFEPEEGRYDWSAIDGALETARERGQTVQVGLMPHGGAGQCDVPQWYRDKYKTVERVTHGKGKPCNCPIYDSPEFIESWGRTVTEFGRRYDGHVDLESVDMSFIGPWGEGAGECSHEGINQMVAVYKAAFRKTPVLALIEGYKMTAGVRAGMGWRADCFGDLGIWEHPKLPREKWWMHHYDCYPQAVTSCGAAEVWRHAPVTFETCSVPMTWYEKGFDLEFILQQGLKFHASVFMPKSATLPEPWLTRLERFCNDLGYRFVLRQFAFDSRAKRGTSFEWSAWIENVGVAPIYRRYAFAVRLTQGKRNQVSLSSDDIRTWLPGDVCPNGTIELPGEFEKGPVMLHVAFVDAEAGVPKVRFASEGADPDGWLPLEPIQIV